VLTDTGYEVLAAAAPGHVEAVRRVLFDPLTPTQMRHLGEICKAVLEAGVDGLEDSAVHRRLGMRVSSRSED
jgi:hypothetical protein